MNHHQPIAALSNLLYEDGDRIETLTFNATVVDMPDDKSACSGAEAVIHYDGCLYKIVLFPEPHTLYERKKVRIYEDEKGTIWFSDKGERDGK